MCEVTIGWCALIFGPNPNTQRGEASSVAKGDRSCPRLPLRVRRTYLPPKPTRDKAPTPRPAAAGSQPARTSDNTSQPWIGQALATVQEGIKSIQALQRQTAAAHEKILETQAEANRTIQTMIHSTRGLEG